MTENFKSIGKKIRFYRRQKGFTLEVLGGKAGICPKYLGEIERGNTNPTLITILRISKGLDRDITDLLENKSSTDEIIHLERIKFLITGKCKSKIEKIVKALELLLE